MKSKLEYHYKKFDFSQIYPDPLIFPHRFKNKADIEISAFISAIFAYGNITQIMKVLEKVHDLLGEKPSKVIRNEFISKITFKHRFYNEDDIRGLFQLIHLVLLEYGSIEKLFMKNYSSNDKTIKNSLNSFTYELKNMLKKMDSQTQGTKFMFPSPESGSACKRMNLFLRWMVREDDLDFGIWKGIRTDQLIIPVDTHIAKIAKNLKLTTMKNVNWKMAEEITNNLQKYDSKDPVKYDFALCHIGMRKLKF